MAEYYALIKTLHITTVVISITGFILRAGMMVLHEAWLRLRPVRILPHVNDTLLLASGITLAVLSQQYPFEQNWLTMKLVALILYILLGTFALKPRFSKPVRMLFAILAVTVFGYIVAVAITREAWPF